MGKKIICGIDPGTTGAIAIFKKKKLIAIHDMPMEAKSTGKGNQASAIGLSNILKAYKIKIAYVENVHAMPGQGVVSVFSFGRSRGLIEGCLSTLEIPVEFVTPQAWKKHFSLIRKEKDVARTLALQKFPKFADNLRLKKHGGRADAILIGLYGREK